MEPYRSSDRHITRIAARTLVAAITLLFAPILGAVHAVALDRGPYAMEILLNGRPVSEYWHGGTAYIEARKGQEYAIRLRNLTGERIAIALAVDGLNSIDADVTTARDASKWILEPWESITISGWQTSAHTARRFFFTTEKESYGAWLGRAKNLGVITAAVFREKYAPGYPPCPGGPWREEGCPRSEARPGIDSEGERDGRMRRDTAASVPPAGPYESGPGQSSEETPESPDGDRQSAGSPQDAEAGGSHDNLHGERSDGRDRSSETGKKATVKPRLSDDLAATGIGREVGHRVRRVEFDEQETASAILEVRYEFRDALARLGVYPFRSDPGDPLARRERAHGFQEDGYAPDPYRRR